MVMKREVMKCEEIRGMMPDLASGLMEVTPGSAVILRLRGVRRKNGRVPADDGSTG